MPQTETIEIPVELLDKVSKSARTVDGALAGVGNASDKMSRQVNKAGFSFTELSSAINIAQQGLRYLKEGYDFAKEGAQIEFQTQRFDRLAQSIGTTSDALLKDMKVATKGTLSDLEAMNAATDLLSLGLAKNSEEAIRLATVQSGLAMDINQLVLTLTNQTTMRFDQLGVSVDGFKERVKELEEQGYDTNAAFKEAFLQQAEAQLERVGNAADSNAGAFKRFEAQLKDAADTAKKSAGESMAPLAEGLADILENANNLEEQLEKTTGKMNDFSQAGAYQAAIATKDIENRIELVDVYGKQKRAIQENTFALEEQNLATDEMTKTNQDYLNNLRDWSEHVYKARDASQEYLEKNQELVEEKQKLIDQGYHPEGEAIQAVIDKINENEQKYNEYTDQMVEQANIRKLAAIEENLAKDGLTEDELRRIEELGIQWGVYTEDAVMAYQHERDEVARISAEITAEINALPEQKVIDIIMNQKLGGYDIGTEQFNRIAYAGRAAGGPVTGGAPYVVGERGPEVFVPNQSGNIVPNGESVIDYDEFARVIVQAFQRAQ